MRFDENDEFNEKTIYSKELVAPEKVEEIIKELSPSNKKVYDFITSYLLENTYPPVIREICEGTGLASTSSVFLHLGILEEKGLIITKKKEPRAIKVAGYKVVKI